MIEVENVHKAFGDTEVLTGVDLEIEDCNLFAIIGHSGSGKSVLLRHLVGLLQPDRGAVRVGAPTSLACPTTNWRRCGGASGCSFRAGPCSTR